MDYVVSIEFNSEKLNCARCIFHNVVNVLTFVYFKFYIL